MVITKGTGPGESLSSPNREGLCCSYGTLLSLRGGSNLKVFTYSVFRGRYFVQFSFKDELGCSELICNLSI